MTLYAAIEAHAGSGDVWAMNPLVTQGASSGDYNAQGIELDFNNNNAHRGDADAGGGLAPPVSYGLSISGAAFRSTAALLVSGSGRIWNRGIVLANDCIQQSSFQDLGSPNKSIDIRGRPNYGVYQSYAATKNYFAGGVGLGVETPSPSSRLHVRGDVLIDGGGRLLLSVPGEGAGAPLLRRGAVQTTAPESATTVLSGGVVGLDGSGGAWVPLPAQRLFAGGLGTASARHAYHLTPLGKPMPNLHVAVEAGGGEGVSATGGGGGNVMSGEELRFRVEGGAAGGRVSWQVTTTTIIVGTGGEE